MSWFRSWHGAPTDNKWLVIAKRANVKPIHVSGTWWALLDHASQHPERGTVEDFDVETFALFSGMEESHVSRIVTALCEKGLIVDGKVAQWGKRQPKREDETAAARKRAERSRNGGKPPQKGGADIPDEMPKADCHAMSHNVTTDTEQNREDYSVTNVTGGSPKSASDFCKAIFDSGIGLLRRDNPDMSERQARSVIGRWRKSIGDDAQLITILMEAETKSQTLEWVTAAVETRNGKRTAQTSTGMGRTEAGARAALARRRTVEDRPGGAQTGAVHPGDGSVGIIPLPNAVRAIGYDPGR